jgi:hypothetical protein
MFCKIHRTKMNSDEEMAQLSRDDVRLLRIVMQGAWPLAADIRLDHRKSNKTLVDKRFAFPLRAERASEAVQRLLHREPKVARTGD